MSDTPSTSEVAASSIEQARWLTEKVRPHESALRGYLRRQFPSIETDDVVQESYLKLLKAKASGQVSSIKAYFFYRGAQYRADPLSPQSDLFPHPCNQNTGLARLG